MNSGLPNLLTLKETSAYLNCSSSTIHRIIKAGQIDYVKVGGRYRFTEKMILEYIANRTKGANQY